MKSIINDKKCIMSLLQPSIFDFEHICKEVPKTNLYVALVMLGKNGEYKKDYSIALEDIIERTKVVWSNVFGRIDFAKDTCAKLLRDQLDEVDSAYLVYDLSLSESKFKPIGCALRYKFNFIVLMTREIKENEYYSLSASISPVHLYTLESNIDPVFNSTIHTAISRIKSHDEQLSHSIHNVLFHMNESDVLNIIDKTDKFDSNYRYLERTFNWLLKGETVVYGYRPILKYGLMSDETMVIKESLFMDTGDWSIWTLGINYSKLLESITRQSQSGISADTSECLEDESGVSFNDRLLYPTFQKLVEIIKSIYFLNTDKNRYIYLRVPGILINYFKNSSVEDFLEPVTKSIIKEGGK